MRRMSRRERWVGPSSSVEGLDFSGVGGVEIGPLDWTVGAPERARRPGPDIF